MSVTLPSERDLEIIKVVQHIEDALVSITLEDALFMNDVCEVFNQKMQRESKDVRDAYVTICGALLSYHEKL